LKLSDSNSANPAPKKQTTTDSAGTSNTAHTAKDTSRIQQADRSPSPTKSVTPPSAMKKVKETASSSYMQDNVTQDNVVKDKNAKAKNTKDKNAQNGNYTDAVTAKQTSKKASLEESTDTAANIATTDAGKT